MKRSKLFLGITTGLLAVAGFAAAKAKFSGTAHVGYFDRNNNGCTVKSAKQAFAFSVALSGSNIAYTAIGSTHYYLYSQANCNSLPLYTKVAD